MDIEFAICVKDCNIYYQLNEQDQIYLQQGALLQIIDDDHTGVSTVKILHINYATTAISVIDKSYLCERKFLKPLPLKLFRFLISVQSPSIRCELLVKSDILMNVKKNKAIELSKDFLKYFNNIICKVLFIGEAPELGVGDFIGVILLNCSLPLMTLQLQKDFVLNYISGGEYHNSILLSAVDYVKFFIKEIEPPKTIISTPIHYTCVKCGISDHIIHFRNCKHKMCKDCLKTKFKDGQAVELKCDYSISQNLLCQTIISLEHYIFLYPELEETFKAINESNRKVCYKCDTYLDGRIGDSIRISDCKHFLCKQCALNLFLPDSPSMQHCQVRMSNGDECKAAIQDEYLESFMSIDEFDAYQELKLLRFLETTPNSERCKTPNCKHYYILNETCTRYYCKVCENYNCLKCNDVHNGSCKEYERQILDGFDEAKKNELLAKLTEVEIADHELVRSGKVETYLMIEILHELRLKYPNYEDDDLLWAIRQSDDMIVIERSLNTICNICEETFSHNNMFSMFTCEHTFCNHCAKSYFTIQITERTIRDCICPSCKLPTFEGDIEETDYFGILGILLKNYLDSKTYELFDRKTRDRGLLKLKNFVWCVRCENGFEVNPNRVNAGCTECGTIFCIQCNEIWQEQHAGITCPQFKQWKHENDPKLQSEGVAKYLEKNGIECPNCKFKYSLAKGGCLHFTCSQCSYEFCFGCRKPMLAGAKCTKYNDCSTKGLHAHHPRNCLTVLRDCSIASLEGLLTNHNINFTGIPQNGAVCQLPIQRQTPDKIIDCLCEKPTVNNNIGLCDQHYKEGLVDLIIKSKIDPIDILDLGESRAELIRNHVALPVLGSTDTDVTYHAKCIAAIKLNIPLI